MSKKLLTRSELAEFISQARGDVVTVDQVIGNEKRWGLNLARRDLNKRVIRYDLVIAERELVSKEVIPAPPA